MRNDTSRLKTTSCDLSKENIVHRLNPIWPPVAFSALISKTGRLTGSELLFVRSYLGLTQLQFSKQVGLANHSRVSQWEKKGLKATGMDYPAELTVRLIMAAAIEEQLISKVYKILAKNRIKDNTTPVELHDDAA